MVMMSHSRLVQALADLTDGELKTLLSLRRVLLGKRGPGRPVTKKPAKAKPAPEPLKSPAPVVKPGRKENALP